MFSKYDFILKMSECFCHDYSVYDVKNEKTKKDYTIAMEHSLFKNDSCDIMVFENKNGTPDLKLQFFQIKYDNIEETEKVISRILDVIEPYKKTLDEIIQELEEGKITFKQYNKEMKDIDR